MAPRKSLTNTSTTTNTLTTAPYPPKKPSAPADKPARATTNPRPAKTKVDDMQLDPTEDSTADSNATNAAPSALVNPSSPLAARTTDDSAEAALHLDSTKNKCNEGKMEPEQSGKKKDQKKKPRREPLTRLWQMRTIESTGISPTVYEPAKPPPFAKEVAIRNGRYTYVSDDDSAKSIPAWTFGCFYIPPTILKAKNALKTPHFTVSVVHLHGKTWRIRTLSQHALNDIWPDFLASFLNDYVYHTLGTVQGNTQVALYTGKKADKSLMTDDLFNEINYLVRVGLFPSPHTDERFPRTTRKLFAKMMKVDYNLEDRQIGIAFNRAVNDQRRAPFFDYSGYTHARPPLLYFVLELDIFLDDSSDFEGSSDLDDDDSQTNIPSRPLRTLDPLINGIFGDRPAKWLAKMGYESDKAARRPNGAQGWLLWVRWNGDERQDEMTVTWEDRRIKFSTKGTRCEMEGCTRQGGHHYTAIHHQAMQDVTEWKEFFDI